MTDSVGLAFQKTECLGCGGDRTLGSSCPECGRAGRKNEVNAHVVRRQSGLRLIDELVRDAHATATFSGDLPSDSAVSALLNELAHGIRLFASTDGSTSSVEQLADLLSRLNSLRFTWSRTPMLRPTMALVKATQEALDSIHELWLAWERVLGAPTLEEVQRTQLAALPLMESAGTTLDKYSAAANAVAVYEDHNEPSNLKRTLSALQRSHPELSFGESARQGSLIAMEELGVPVSPSVGAQYLALIGVADVHFDSERFRKVLKESARFCFNNAYLEELSQCPGALLGLANTQRAMMESLKALEAIMQIEDNDQSILRRIFSFYGEVYENVAAPIFAWYCRLAGLKSMPYEKLIELDATKLAERLESSKTTSGWFLGADAYLRNADGHGSKTYSIDGELVTFNLRSFRGTLSKAEVLDKFYSLFESLAAVSWSLNNALDQAQIEVPVSEADVQYLGMSPLEVSCLWLERHDETLVSASATDGNWEIQLASGASVASDIALRLATAQPGDFQQIKIHRQSSVEPLLVIPFDRYTNAKVLEDSGVDEVGRILAELELKMASRLGGNSIVTREDIGFAIGIFGMHLLSPDKTMMRHMRVARTAAVTEHHSDLMAVADRVFLAFRNPNFRSAAKLGSELRQLICNRPSKFPVSNNVLIKNGAETPGYSLEESRR